VSVVAVADVDVVGCAAVVAGPVARDPDPEWQAARTARVVTARTMRARLIALDSARQELSVTSG
jgi:hypothetical protein